MERCPNITLYLKQSKNIQMGPVKTFVMLIFSCIKVYFYWSSVSVSQLQCPCQYHSVEFSGRKVKFCFRYRSYVFSILEWAQGTYENMPFFAVGVSFLLQFRSVPIFTFANTVSSSNKTGYCLRDFSLTKTTVHKW